MSDITLFSYYKNRLRAFRFCKKLERHLLYRAETKEDRAKIKLDKAHNCGKITSKLIKIDESITRLNLFLLPYVDSFEQAASYLSMVIKSIRFGFDEYFSMDTVFSLLRKGKDNLELYFNMAREFDHYKLEENEQGNFTKFSDYDTINDKFYPKIIDILIKTKLAEAPLKQKTIIKFFDAVSNHSDEKEEIYTEQQLLDLLESFKRAWVFQKEHDLSIDLLDIIFAVKNKRDPFNYVKNFWRIKVNEIPFIYENYKNIPLPEADITKFIGLIIKAKFSEVLLNVEDLYQEILMGVNVIYVLGHLLKFINIGYDDFDYIMLRNFMFLGGNLEIFFEAIIYNEKNMKLPPVDVYKYILKILGIKGREPLLNELQFVKALNSAKAYHISIDNVIDDYLIGIDVYNVLSQITYAKKNNINIDYENAKLIEKTCYSTSDDPKSCLKAVVSQTLNPFYLENESFLVTTKDNIEIKAQIIIEAVLQIENYFKGSDEKVLFNRASAIFIDEIQRKYNHDEIIVNIEKISNNVLYRLLNETRQQLPEYVYGDGMTKTKTEDYHGHKNTEHSHTEHHNETKEHEHLELIDDKHHVENEHSKHHETENHHESLANEIKRKILNLPKQSDIESDKFIKVSKYKPLKVLIPKIEFIKGTFKEFEKEIKKYKNELHEHHIHLEEKEAEIRLKEEWAKGNFNKYIIFKDDDNEDELHHKNIDRNRKK